ncbi:hypothetical protein [Halomontanus rarus]|uniref:hypothetical protein n=1 Tax=Halomontanus rarus TaxID=3034020 RepID=UPI0023E77276|nr:hypothetical protein [Halovivax sp. TS33]
MVQWMGFTLRRGELAFAVTTATVLAAILFVDSDHELRYRFVRSLVGWVVAAGTVVILALDR